LALTWAPAALEAPGADVIKCGMPTLSIERQEFAAQPVLFVRSTVARSELATAIGLSIGRSYAQAQKAGVAVGGRPFTRYTK
jgi:hypothetical protein